MIINNFIITDKEEDEVFQFGVNLPGATYTNGKITSIKQTNSTSDSPFFDVCRYGLTYVRLDDCITVGPSAFMSYRELVSADLPACTSIGWYAFERCSALTTVNAPACKYIGESAFISCSALTSANFPLCTTIGERAFKYCSALSLINFPACTSIGL